MLRNYYRQLLAFIFIITSITANGQGFGVSTSARYADGCRLDFYNSTNVKIFSLRGSELRYTYNSSGQIIVRDENIQITDVFGISGLAALIDSVQSICLAGLCSGGSTPVETFSYCMSPTFDLWSPASLDNPDTITGSMSCGGVCPLVYVDNQYQAHIYNSLSPLGDDETLFFRLCQTSQYTCDQIDACLQDTLYSASQCAIINYFNIEANGVGYTSIDSALCFGNTNNIPSQTYFLDVADGDTTTLYQILTTINSDTTIRQDISIPFNESQNEVLRILGVTTTGLSLDTTNSTLTVTAKPAKTSETTYQASSFKIEKIAFADITASTISGSSYNPNLGEQFNTFALTTGKNTFKVSVADTNGNVAYTIFQVTKTAL